MIDSSFRDEIRNLGTAINPQTVASSMAIYGRYVADTSPAMGRVERDIAYGSHDRHRLDIFAPADGESLPVLVYVHGGGFIGGDKAIPGTPFHENIGGWAVQHGFVGVPMTYRLAPENPWPAGAEDVAAAITWLRRNVAGFGGSPERIFLAGQSAGAVHVASYVAMRELHDAAPPVAGAMMFSGLYDVVELEKGPLELQYFGSDGSLAPQQSSLSGLIASEVPMLFSVAEHDPPTFQKQAALLIDHWFARKQTLPRMLYMPDANHMSAALGIGGADEFLAPEIAAFIARFSSGA